MNNYSAGRILPVITSSGKKYLISPLSYCTAIRLDTGRFTTIPSPNTVVTFKPRTNVDISCSSFSPSFLWIKGWESTLQRRSLYAAKTTEAMEKINPEKRLTQENSDLTSDSGLSYNSMKFISDSIVARPFPKYLVKGTLFRLSLKNVSARNVHPHNLSCDHRGLWILLQHASFWIMSPECPDCPLSSVLSGTKKYMAYETKNTPHSS